MFGFGSAILNIALVTTRQMVTPRRLLGRVNATARVLIMSSLPVGSVVFGAAGQRLGIKAALWITAIGLCGVCVLFAPLMLRLTTHGES
jgi:hypothetical protein